MSKTMCTKLSRMPPRRCDSCCDGCRIREILTIALGRRFDHERGMCLSRQQDRANGHSFGAAI